MRPALGAVHDIAAPRLRGGGLEELSASHLRVMPAGRRYHCDEVLLHQPHVVRVLTLKERTALEQQQAAALIVPPVVLWTLRTGWHNRSVILSYRYSSGRLLIRAECAHRPVSQPQRRCLSMPP